MAHRRGRAALLLMIGVAALLTGCGGDDPPAAEARRRRRPLPTPCRAPRPRWRRPCRAPTTSAGLDPTRLGEAQSLYGEGEPPVPTFGESVSLWESPDVARERLGTFASITAECRSFEHRLEAGRTATVTITEQAAPPLGDVVVLTEGPDLAEGDPELDRQRERFDDLTARAVEKATRTLGS